MHRYLFAAILFISAGTSAFAQSTSFNSRDLPYDIKTVSCDEIIAHTNTNKHTKAMAASLYAHGMIMGKRCIKIDYIRAFELYIELGNPGAMQPILQHLLSRANTGNPRAISWLKKLKKAGYINYHQVQQNR